jgi:hypothetical protein
VRLDAPAGSSFVVVDQERAYLRLHREGRLGERVESALEELRDRRVCPSTTRAPIFLRSLELLDGIVDVHMPDFKFWRPEPALRLSLPRDYPERARAAIAEMPAAPPLALRLNRRSTRSRALDRARS